jgi:hypothetical protein
MTGEWMISGSRFSFCYKKPKTESSIRDAKLPKFVVEALREQRKRTWKGEGIHQHHIRLRLLQGRSKEKKVT